MKINKKVIFTVMLIFVMISSFLRFSSVSVAANTTRWNVSSSKVTGNASSSGLPSDATIYTNNSYYFNFQVDSGQKIRKAELYVKDVGKNDYSKVGTEDTKSYFRYVWLQYKFGETSGVAYYYWKITFVDGSSTSTKTMDVTKINVTVEVPQGNESVVSGDYHIVSAVDNSYGIDINGASKDNGANVQIYKNTTDSTQVFNVSYLGNGYYKIVNKNSDKCLDVNKSGIINGTNVLQYTWGNKDNQQWVIKDAGDGYFYIISKCNGLYLEINGGKVYAKCNVDVWKGNGGSNTKWKFVSASSTTTNIASTAIELSKSALICSVVGSETTITATMMPSNTTDIVTWTSSNSNVVSVDNGKLKAKSVGDAVITATTTSGKIATCKIVVINEKTISNGTYTIATAINNSKMLDVYKSTVANGTNVQIYSKNNSNNQKFIITKLSSGWYKIIDANSGKALDVKGGSAKDGVNVQIYDYNGTDAQLWKFYDAGNGQYFIKNKLGYYLALGSSTVSNGANVAVYSLKVPSVANQKWILSSTTINKVSVSTASVTLNQNTFTYDGKDKKPSVTSVKVNSKTLKSGTDFKVTYQNCKNVGTGSVVITGIGDYTGSKTVTFSIKLATPTLQLTGNGTSIGTSWNKIDGADGYQIKWFDSTNYDDSKKLGSSSTTSLSRTISGLKSGKTYYVRLRAYKEISGGRNYSNYVTKSVKLPNENTFDPIWPVEGSFQVNAMYYYKDGTKHQSGWGYANCIDIGNNGVNGRNIKAIESGTIIEAGWQNVSGYRVEIKHNNGTKTRYCHLQKGSITVSKGDTVSKGQVIGKMGQSGNATGVHLHLDYTGGDPWNLFKDKYKTSIKYQLNVRSNNVAKKNKDSYSKAIVEWIDQYYKKSGSYYIYK